MNVRCCLLYILSHCQWSKVQEEFLWSFQIDPRFKVKFRFFFLRSLPMRNIRHAVRLCRRYIGEKLFVVMRSLAHPLWFDLIWCVNESTSFNYFQKLSNVSRKINFLQNVRIAINNRIYQLHNFLTSVFFQYEDLKATLPALQIVWLDLMRRRIHNWLNSEQLDFYWIIIPNTNVTTINLHIHDI